MMDLIQNLCLLFLSITSVGQAMLIRRLRDARHVRVILPGDREARALAKALGLSDDLGPAPGPGWRR